MSKTKLAILCSLLAAALILPFLAGQILAGSDHVFGGFLLNPVDGNSYLAKMRLGVEGEWRFQLPYTAEPGKGAYLFLFYILLGHLSRILGLSLPVMFHMARLAASGFLVFALYRFLTHSVKGDFKPAVGIILILAVLGSGLGWIDGLFGGFTSDFWVAEAYPFLTMYSNPHFPLGLGLALVYLDLIQREDRIRWAPAWILFGTATAIIQPFVIVVCAIISIVYITWDWRETRRLKIWLTACFLAGGGGFLFYEYFAIVNDPVLSIWNAQNITQSPPLWDFLVSFSPAFILAVAGLIGIIRRKVSADYKVLVIWLIAGAILAYIPFSLQRRFLLGLFLPCAVLGGIGIWILTANRIKLQRFLGRLVIIVSVVTNVFVLLGGVLASINHDPWLFISKDEKNALDWMSSNSDISGLTLASEQTGLFIPAYSSWRVLYGHPFETVDAEQRKDEINAVFDGSNSQAEIEGYITREQVKYVFWGPRERMNRTDNPFAGFESIYENQSVTIYATGVKH